MINKIWQGFQVSLESKEAYIKRMNQEFELYNYTKAEVDEEQSKLPEAFTEDLYVDWNQVKIIQLRLLPKANVEGEWWQVLIDGLEVYSAPNTYKGYVLANQYKMKCLKAWNEAKLFQDLEDDNRL